MVAEDGTGPGRLTRRGFATALAVVTPGLGRAATVEVGAGRGPARLGAVDWRSLAPGDEVVVRGSHEGPVVVTARGAPGRPVVVRGEAGAEIRGALVFEGAADVVVEGLAVQGAPYPGVILRHGAERVTVQRLQVADNALGIWIGEGAGAGHRILDNVVTNSKTHGIAVDVINCPVGQETLIAGNRVSRSGMHGLEINGNGYVIDGNRVWDNGLALSGTSGIHVFCKDAGQGTGRRNVIRRNVVSGQRETSGVDGNGIQLDQWCDGNDVCFNVCFGNDGAGVILFDAADNRVWNNLLFGNMRDSGRRHVYRAEFVIASDYTKKVDHSHGNTVLNNIMAPADGVAAILVDPYSSGTQRGIARNALASRGAGPLWIWGRESGRDLAGWNGRKPGAPDLDLAPDLAGRALPRDADADLSGLAPPPGSALATAGVPVPSRPERDLLGTPLLADPVGALGPRR